LFRVNKSNVFLNFTLTHIQGENITTFSLMLIFMYYAITNNVSLVASKSMTEKFHQTNTVKLN